METEEILTSSESFYLTNHNQNLKLITVYFTFFQKFILNKNKNFQQAKAKPSKNLKKY